MARDPVMSQISTENDVIYGDVSSTIPGFLSFFHMIPSFLMISPIK
jgi:hypothetical protein